MNNYFARLEQRIDELEDYVIDMEERLKHSNNISMWLSIATIAATLIAGVLQAAATWYK